MLAGGAPTEEGGGGHGGEQHRHGEGPCAASPGGRRSDDADLRRACLPSPLLRHRSSVPFLQSTLCPRAAIAGSSSRPMEPCPLIPYANNSSNPFLFLMLLLSVQIQQQPPFPSPSTQQQNVSQCSGFYADLICKEK
ncbi:hypothetical protein U9M48_015551 [Paspalum notatum var. saurae]|uniref:Uncharacterized protein n=1 Tax=Paspalum notatum var. saurae TaxID=547442 RepID=A0AAQ3WLZ4_PASNO